MRISLKPSVLDPQGETVKRALGSLGFESVSDVRAGKYFEITLDAKSATEAEAAVEQMCSKLLANPVIEQYAYEVVRLGGTHS